MRRPKPVYPPSWRRFSHQIRAERAQGQCECVGECGLHCTHPGPRRCQELDGHLALWARGMVRLTVAHLCACSPPCAHAAHVKAMCNRCHLRVDLPLHLRHAAETRRLSKEQRGQIALLPEEGNHAP